MKEQAETYITMTIYIKSYKYKSNESKMSLWMYLIEPKSFER